MKPDNLAINLTDDDTLIMKPDATLRSYNIGSCSSRERCAYSHFAEDDTEISFFNREEYENYKKNPVRRLM